MENASADATRRPAHQGYYRAQLGRGWRNPRVCRHWLSDRCRAYHPEYDYTVTFLLHSLLRGDALSDLTSASVLPEADRDALEVLLTGEIANFQLSKTLISRHPGILPYALTELLNTFREMDASQLIAIAPVLPESEDAVDRYMVIFQFINQHLRANWAMAGPRRKKRLMQLAILSVEWMRGRPFGCLNSIARESKRDARRTRRNF